ncbi:MAG: hypothetical protein ACR2HR_07425 [Euzebya sp.]
MSAQPTSVQAAFLRMVGPEGHRISTSRQAILIDVLGDLNQALGGPVDTSDPAQAAALVTILDAISSSLGNRSGNLPLDQLADLLSTIDGLVGDLLDTTALADLVAGLGVDTLPEVGALVGTVSGLLNGSTGFTSSQSLVDQYGEAARGLADAVDAVTS